MRLHLLDHKRRRPLAAADTWQQRLVAADTWKAESLADAWKAEHLADTWKPERLADTWLRLADTRLPLAGTWLHPLLDACSWSVLVVAVVAVGSCPAAHIQCSAHTAAVTLVAAFSSSAAAAAAVAAASAVFARAPAPRPLSGLHIFGLTQEASDHKTGM